MTAPVREFDSTKKLPTDLMNTAIDFPTLSSSLFNEQLATSSIPHEWLLSGDPRTRSKLLGRTPDRLAYAMLWECGAVSYKWNYSRDEAYIVLSGEGFMTDDKGIEHRYGAGDLAFFPGPLPKDRGTEGSRAGGTGCTTQNVEQIERFDETCR